MPRMKVTLSKEDIQQAVSEWAEKHHGMKISSEAVVVSAQMTWIGHGQSEAQVPETVISFNT